MNKRLFLFLFVFIPFQAMAWKHLTYLNKAPELSIAYKFIKNHEIKFCNKSPLINDEEVVSAINSWLEAGLNNVDLSTSTISECDNPDILINETSFPVNSYSQFMVGGFYQNTYDKAEVITELLKELEEVKDRHSDEVYYDSDASCSLAETLEFLIGVINSVEFPSIFFNKTIPESIRQYNLQRDILHEIGHAFGMGDEDDSADGSGYCDPVNQSSTRDDSSIMSFENDNKILSPGDKEGIAKIFERLK